MSKQLDKYREISKIRDELTKESDRGSVLLSVAYLETNLEQLLKDYLVFDKKIFEKLFNGQSTLSSFSSKIDISFSLGLITKRVHKDLDNIRNIRNEFAHSSIIIDFESQKIKDLSKNLVSHYHNSDASSRRIFISTVYGILSFINRKQLTLIRINELKEDIETENNLKEMTLKHLSIHEEYYEILKEAYRDSPNKDALLKEDFEEYIREFHKLSELILVKAEENKNKG